MALITRFQSFRANGESLYELLVGGSMLFNHRCGRDANAFGLPFPCIRSAFHLILVDHSNGRPTTVQGAKKRMAEPSSYQVVAEQTLEDSTIQLVEDQQGGYHLRQISSEGRTIRLSGPVHCDQAVLAEARAHFPDFLPFGGVPVDAT